MARDDVYRLSTCLSLPTIPAISKYLTKADRIMTVWMLSCLRGLSWGSSRCLSARASSSLSLTSLDFCQWGRPVSTQIPISATSLAETCRGLAALHGVFICLQLTPLLLAWHLESILQTQGGERYQSCPTPWQTFYSDLDARFSAANKSRINCTQSPISQNLRLKKRWKLFTKMASCERNVACLRLVAMVSSSGLTVRVYPQHLVCLHPQRAALVNPAHVVRLHPSNFVRPSSMAPCPSSCIACRLSWSITRFPLTRAWSMRSVVDKPGCMMGSDGQVMLHWSARAVLSTRHVHLSLNKRLNVKVKMSLSYFSFSFLSYSLSSFFSKM